MIQLVPEERGRLEKVVSSRSSAQKLVWRARVLLAAASGGSLAEIARRAGVDASTVRRWIDRFREDGVEGIFSERPRGNPEHVPVETEELVVQLVVRKTLHDRPPMGTRWSTRSMAATTGISRMSVQRIWAKYGLKPQRTKTFKLSTDPQFAEKVQDVVGLYVDPPDHAVVLSVDEKSQIQALERTQEPLPQAPEHPETETHDYVRHGTTTLFAALNVLDGTVIGSCKARHRHQEFLEFLQEVETAVDPMLDLHIILDNYTTHKHAVVRQWVEEHPRIHLHFTPTASSWLNQVERFFSKLTTQRLRRATFASVADLEAAIADYLAHHNRAPKPFRWHKSAPEILRRTDRARHTLQTIRNAGRQSGTPH